MMMAVRMRTMSTRGGGKDANDEDKGDGGGAMNRTGSTCGGQWMRTMRTRGGGRG